ncbi:MAG: LamG domain-containing protein, partial [Gammaproteobacteria bacterium]
LNYRFDTGAGNVAFDSSGNGLNGSRVNAPAWIPGQLGSALSFDGAGAYVDSGVSTDLAEWTVAFWVRSPSAPARGAANGPVHRERNFAISWDHPAATFRGAAAMRAGGNWYAASFGSLAADTWYHLTATYDGETLKAYTNGVLVTANASPAGAPDPEVATMTVGRHAKSQSFFAGDVDELRIYQRALTPAEIDALTP